MSHFYNPYREKYGKHVVKHYIHLKPPLDGFADDKTLSTNLTLGEIRKSSYIMPDEQNLFAYVPIDTRVIQAFQILRDALGKPITVTSSFRSVRHELSKERSGESQHTYGAALDLSGSGLVELVQEALATKNSLCMSDDAATESYKSLFMLVMTHQERGSSLKLAQVYH